MNKKFGINIVSSYIPRRCGIATFSNDLANSLIELGEQYNVNITALNDNSEGYKYPREVNFEINDKSINDFREAAHYLNLSDSNIINIQQIQQKLHPV